MTVMMLATVLSFAVLNYVIKAAGPFILSEHEMPEPAEAILAALPSSLLAGMLISSLAGERWSALDLAVVIGLCGAVVAWSLRAPSILSVGIAVLVVVAVRWLS